jgi:membrane protease YdiL (CAAX protease family)
VLEEVIELTVLPSMALSQIASISFSLLVLRLIVGPNWTREIALRKPSWTHFTLTLLLFPAVVILANGIYALMKELLPSLADLSGVEGMPGMEEMVKQFGEWPLPLAILMIGVGPGVGEELWCRGFLGRGLVGRYGLVFGVLWTSLLFGLIHIDPRQGTMAALMGIVLHLLYLFTRTLWMPILLHFLNNSLAMIGVKVGGELGKLDQAPEMIPSQLYAAAVVLFVVVGSAIYSCRARLRDLETDGGTWRPVYPGVAYPPAESITRVEHPPLHPIWWGFVLAAAGYFGWVVYRVLAAGLDGPG